MMIINVGDMDVGFMVDEVSEILRIDEEQIKEPPEFVANVHRKYISAIADMGERSLIILDFEYIMSETEKEDLKMFLQEERGKEE